MTTHSFITALWLGALCAVAHGVRAHLEGDLGYLAERMAREIGTPIRA